MNLRIQSSDYLVLSCRFIGAVYVVYNDFIDLEDDFLKQGRRIASGFSRLNSFYLYSPQQQLFCFFVIVWFIGRSRFLVGAMGLSFILFRFR